MLLPYCYCYGPCSRWCSAWWSCCSSTVKHGPGLLSMRLLQPLQLPLTPPRQPPGPSPPPPLVQPAPATAPPDAASDLDEVLQCMKAVLLACTARWGGGAAYLLLMPAIEGLLVADQVSRSGEGPASLAGNKM